jgi:hypothetical protein
MNPELRMGRDDKSLDIKIQEMHARHIYLLDRVLDIFVCNFLFGWFTGKDVVAEDLAGSLFLLAYTRGVRRWKDLLGR